MRGRVPQGRARLHTIENLHESADLSRGPASSFKLQSFNGRATRKKYDGSTWRPGAVRLRSPLPPRLRLSKKQSRNLLLVLLRVVGLVIVPAHNAEPHPLLARRRQKRRRQQGMIQKAFERRSKQLNLTSLGASLEAAPGPWTMSLSCDSTSPATASGWPTSVSWNTMAPSW